MTVGCSLLKLFSAVQYIVECISVLQLTLYGVSCGKSNNWGLLSVVEMIIVIVFVFKMFTCFLPCTATVLNNENLHHEHKFQLD